MKKKQYPLILFWEFNHFVVLEGIENDVVYLNDPAMGRRQLPWKEFRTSYTGVYIEVRPDKEKFVAEGQPYSIVKAMANKLSEDKWAVLFVLILGLCMIIPGLAVPVMNQIFIDDIFSMKHPDWTQKLFLAMIGAMILSGVMTAIRSSLLNYWRKKLTLSVSLLPALSRLTEAERETIMTTRDRTEIVNILAAARVLFEDEEKAKETED